MLTAFISKQDAQDWQDKKTTADPSNAKATPSSFYKPL
jgi:hypothetical protein